jgi:pimeloyl-ACP methyl ester carboxylesterase
MADDAIAILDGYGIDRAHIVGMSMGGMLAQQVALRYPDRVRTATFISTSPLGVKTCPRPPKPTERTRRKARRSIDRP